MLLPAVYFFNLQMNEVKWSDDDSVDSQRVKNIVSFDFESQRSGKIIDIDD